LDNSDLKSRVTSELKKVGKSVPADSNFESDVHHCEALITGVMKRAFLNYLKVSQRGRQILSFDSYAGFLDALRGQTEPRL
jgi:nucleotidyltransferase/DNA polymerase involved in DNA repair